MFSSYHCMTQPNAHRANLKSLFWTSIDIKAAKQAPYADVLLFQQVQEKYKVCVKYVPVCTKPYQQIGASDLTSGPAACIERHKLGAAKIDNLIITYSRFLIE